MTRAHWDEESQAEFNILIQEATAAGRSTRDRTDRFMKGLLDAEQAHRPWAIEVLGQCARVGAQGLLKREWKSNNSVLVSHDGRVVSKPRVIGVNVKSAEGKMFAQQTFFDVMTVQQLHEKRSEYITQIRAYDSNLATIDKLLALCEAGAADTPELAASNLGTTVETWLEASAA
jgi:hypothetical protein